MQNIEALFQKLLRGQCSPEEAQHLFNFFSTPEGDPELVRLIEHELDSLSDKKTGSNAPFAMANNLEKLRGMIKPPKRKPVVYRLWPYAAAVVLALAVGVWGWQGINWNTSQVVEAQAITPGGNRATLTLADGRKIGLSEAQNGIVVGDGFTYLDGSDVLEQRAKTAEQGEGSLQYAILSTPKGGTYQITLPDRTRVWLNSASTLKYPTHFDDTERVVELHGEGYFEVTENRDKPFRVISERQQVVVLGTTFNITSYADEEEVKTTLVEGKVKVSLNQLGNPMSVLLFPSEQAQLRDGQLSKQVVDVETEIAWKKGLFAFRGKKLEDIMRQIARWYDVEIVIEDGIASRTFSGTVSRYADINELLTTLALTGKIQFELRGKTIVVKPK